MIKYLIVLSLLITTLFASSIDQEKVILQLNWKYQFEFAGFIMAKEKGFYKEVGIDLKLKEFKVGTNVVDDVVENRATFGVSDSALILESIKGKPVVGLMTIFQHSPFVLLGLKSSGIKTLKDLNDKNLALLEDIDGITILSMLKSNHIKYNTHPKVFDFNKLISKELDMISAYATNEIFIAKEQGLDIITFDPRDYGFDSYGDILFTSKETIKKYPKMVQNFYDASKRGWEYAFENINETVEMIFNNYNTLHKSKEALLFEANAVKKISGYGTNFGELDLGKLKAISNLYTFLISDKYDIDNLNNFIYSRPVESIVLTQEEKAYLRDNPVTYAGDPDWLPFEAFDAKGNYVGIIAEHIAIVEKKLHKKFDKIITKNWLDTLALSEKRGVDIISGDAADVVLSQNYKAIDPYIKNPLVIVTQKDHQYVDDLNNIKDKKIAFIDGYGYSADILKKYPDIKFIKSGTLQSALLGVKTGQYDAFVGALASVEYTILQMGIEDIKITGEIDIVMNLTLFVDKEKPLLYSIINKSIKMISKEKQHEIISKWRSNTVIESVNYKLLWQSFLLFSIISLIGILFLFILKRNNHKLNKLVNATIEGIVIFKNGKLVEANQQFLDMYGYGKRKEILGKRVFDFAESSQHSFLKEQLKKDREPYEVTMLKKDNTLFPGLVRGTQLDANTRISSILNLSELKDTQNKLKALNRSLEERVEEEVEKNKQHQLIMMQQSRLAQVGEIINMIAHQWRQPLNNLSIISQALVLKYRLGKANDTTMNTYNADFQKQINGMTVIIDDFRDFFKPEKEKKIFDINESIDHAIEILSPVLQDKKIKLTVSMKGSGYIYGFSNELGQSIINIISNAKDALLEKSIEEKHIDIDLIKNDRQIILTISDNAGGVPEDIIDQIFNPYFSTKEKNGTGLGLYMSKIIIEEHMKGEVTVENTNKGAQFKIVFDRVKDGKVSS